MSKETSVILSKVVPPRRRADVLRRQRLINELHQNIDRRLLIICAPAGYGKTTLLLDFIQDLEAPVAWLSLSESESDLPTFVQYLIAAVRQPFPDFNPALPSYQAEPTTLATAIVNELWRAVPDFLLLALDDYHLVNHNRAINHFLDALVQHLPDYCAVAIASRVEPTLTPRGLALLTVQQQIMGLGTEHLRFTPDEIVGLVKQNFAKELPESALQVLAQETEGWIAAIVLGVQPTFQGLVNALSEGGGSRQRLYSYLASEVLEQQPEEVQAFLLGSSVLDEINPHFTDTLLGIHNSEVLLQHLEEQNLFLFQIERGQERWYRYHHLFQDFLQRRLQGKTPEWARKLQQRAAGFLEQQGQLEAALKLALVAANYKRAAGLLERLGTSLDSAGRYETLLRWLEDLPDEILRESPQLLYLRGRANRELGRLDAACDDFAAAGELFEAGGDLRWYAQCNVQHAVAVRYQGRYVRAQRLAEQAEAILAQVAPDSSEYAGAQNVLGITLSLHGQLQEGNHALRRALQLYEQHGDVYNIAVVLDALGANLTLLGELAGAEHHFQQALQRWEQLENYHAMAVTLNNLGYIQASRGEYQVAQGSYTRATEIARRGGNARVEAYCLTSLGDVYRDLGELDEALTFYNEARQLAEQSSNEALLSYLLWAEGDAERLRGEHSRAIELVRQAYEQARERSAQLEVGRAATTLGVISYEAERFRPAERYLNEACQLLEECDARRELASTLLHRAYFYHLRGQDEHARRDLEAALDCLFELGYDGFLHSQLRRQLSLLRWAAESGVGGKILRRLLEAVGGDDAVPEVRRQSTQVAATPRRDDRLPLLQVYGFGTGRIQVGDRVLTPSDWRSAVARDILFYLLCEGPTSREQLGLVFWPDSDPAKLRSTFHVTMHRLRRALEPLKCVVFENDEYSFDLSVPHEFDVAEFERWIVEARDAPETAMQRTAYEKALALYQGDFLAEYRGPAEEWQREKMLRLQGEYLSALEAWAAILLKDGQYDDAISAYRQAIATDELRESAHRGLMHALWKTGSRNAALRHYHGLLDLLRAELGVDEPDLETQSLYTQIRRQERGLESNR